ncbi:unnamed protein product [Arctogadus glacialis]
MPTAEVELHTRLQCLYSVSLSRRTCGHLHTLTVSILCISIETYLRSFTHAYSVYTLYLYRDVPVVVYTRLRCLHSCGWKYTSISLYLRGDSVSVGHPVQLGPDRPPGENVCQAPLLQQHLSSYDVMQGTDSPFPFERYRFYLPTCVHYSIFVSRQYSGFVTVFQMKMMLMKERLQRMDILMFLYFTMACFDLWRTYLHLFLMYFKLFTFLI